MLRQVYGESMLPNLLPGQLVLAVGFRKPKIGDLIIFKHDGLEKIKRVKRIDHLKYYVEGDNPDDSIDSRQFGLIDRSVIIGKIIWPRTSIS